MSDSKPRLRLSAAQLRPALPVLAALCVLLALWLAWGGGQQLRDANREQALQQARDQAAQGTARVLQQEIDRLGDRLGASALQATLSTGDFAGAAAQL
jgi:phosphomannomutase/phosphoglucomutase